MEKCFSLTYSDPWRFYDSFAGISGLIWILRNHLKNVRGWATIPIVTQRNAREIGEEAGLSGISLNTRSYIIVHSYSRKREIRIDIDYKEGMEIDPEEVISYLEKILPKVCKLIKRCPDPSSDEVA